MPPGGQSRPPLRSDNFLNLRRGRCPHRPNGNCGFALDFRKNGSHRRGDVLNRPLRTPRKGLPVSRWNSPNKKDTPVPCIGTRVPEYFVVPPKFEELALPRMPRSRGGNRRFRETPLYARSADVLRARWPQKSFSLRFPLCPAALRYCFRVLAVLYYSDECAQWSFLALIIILQSRSPRCRPRISISAEARFVAHGTLCISHSRSVRMMR